MNYAMNMPQWVITDPFARPMRRHRGGMKTGAEGASEGRGRVRGDRLANDADESREGRRGRRREGFGKGFGPRGPERGFGPGAGFGPQGPGAGFGPGFGPFGPGGGFGHKPHGHGPRHHRARRGDVRMAALHLLAEQPRNGYQLIQELGERTGGLWKPSAGAIYPALSALEDEGLIAPTGEGKVFALTDAGRQAVEQNPTKPWEAFTAQGQQFQASGQGALWQEFGQLADALRAVSTSATADQLDQATQKLGQLRRDLFALLASPVSSDVPSQAEPDESGEDPAQDA